jgi:hypothetical protein
MAARAKIEEDPKKVYIADIPEDVRKTVIYPMLGAQDLFRTALLSKKEGALSKDALEASRLEALQTKRQQLFELIKQRDMENMLFYEKRFPLIRSIPPNMDVVNEQLERIVPTIKRLKEKPIPQFQRSPSIDYSGILDSDGILLSEPPNKKGGGFWDNDDYIKWKKDYDEGNWGKKGYTGSGGWSDMIPFRHIFGLGKKSYRELERMSGGGNEPQSVEQYFKDKSYWAYPRQNTMVLQGGSGEQPPNAGPPPPNLRLANAVVYEFANQRVVRIEYNEREQVISRQTFRSTRYLDANHRIIYQGGLQEVPDEERDVFWEAITEANRGREGKIELLLDED